MADGIVVKHAAATPFARGYDAENRQMEGKRTAETTPFATSTTVFPSGVDAPL